MEPTRLETKPPRLLGSSRLGISIMCCLGTFVSIMMSINMSFAMVCMQRNTWTNSTELENSYNATSEDNRTMEKSEFNWDPETRGVLLGANFYGVVSVQWFTGWLVDKYRKSRTVALAGIILMSCSTVITPAIAHAGVPYLITFRILAGAGSGLYFASLMSLLSSWITPQEQGLLVGLAYAGAGMANTLTFPIASFLCEHAGGWPSIFYFTGICGFVWSVLGLFLMYDNPKKHPRVSEEEKQYLLALNEHTALKTKDVNIPWKKILTSIPVWTVVATNFFWFGVYKATVIFLPIFMRDILDFSVQENGIFSGLPALSSFICHMAFGPLFDWVSNKNLCSLTALRKIFNSAGCFLPAVAMFTVSQLYPDQKYLIIALVAAAQGTGEFAATGGHTVTLLNLAPQYVGVLQGINSTLGLTPGFLLPMIVGALTPMGTREEWSNVFLLFGSLYVAAGIVFILGASSDRQKWADPQPSKAQTKLI